MTIKYQVQWKDGEDVLLSDFVQTAEEAWAILQTKRIVCTPCINLCVEDTVIKVATMYTVIWTYLSDFVKYRNVPEVREAVFALERTNQKAGRLGSPDSLGIFDSLVEC